MSDGTRIEPEPFWDIERMLGGDGYDVMEVASRHGWHSVAGWGSDGWDLCSWPYYVVYIRTVDARYQLATYCEGDIDVWTFETVEQRSAHIDGIAFAHWKSQGDSWVDGIEEGTVPEHLRGPYRSDRTPTAS